MGLGPTSSVLIFCFLRFGHRTLDYGNGHAQFVSNSTFNYYFFKKINITLKL